MGRFEAQRATVLSFVNSIFLTILAILGAVFALPGHASAQVNCARTITADIVALDQVIM